MAASSNTAYMFVDVDFNGKLHKNANYVQGCSVEDAYLRWVPLCGARENKKRKASIHMVLTLGDGSPVDVDAGACFPTTVERVTFVSGGAWADHCPICARLVEATPREELLSFHRRETPIVPAEAAEPEPSTASSRRRNRKEEAGASSSSPTEDAPAPSKDQESSVDAEGPSEGVERGPPEPSSPAPMNSFAVASSECQQFASPLERQDEAPPTPSPAMRAAPPATPSSSAAVQGSPHPAEEACGASADSSTGVRSLNFATPSRVAPLAPSIREVEEEFADCTPGDSGGRRHEVDAQAMAQQLAGLSLIVRDLASTVKETSASVAELRQVVANDHALLQQHLQDAREDRQVMLGLLKALTQQRGLEPSVG